MMETEFFWYHCCAVLASAACPSASCSKARLQELGSCSSCSDDSCSWLMACFHSLCKHPDKQVLEHLIISSSTIREHHHHHHHHHQTNCEDITSEGAADISQVVVVGVK